MYISREQIPPDGAVKIDYIMVNRRLNMMVKGFNWWLMSILLPVVSPTQTFKTMLYDVEGKNDDAPIGVRINAR